MKKLMPKVFFALVFMVAQEALAGDPAADQGSATAKEQPKPKNTASSASSSAASAQAVVKTKTKSNQSND